MNKETMRGYFDLLIKLALTMVASILCFFFLGRYLDEFYSYNGLVLIVFTMLGVFVGFMGVYFQLKAFF
jgi:F0F1-type ATP synthase assembly protein I